MTKLMVAVLVPVAALAIGGCGSSSPSTSSSAAPNRPTSAPPSLTAAQGARICNDLQAWWKIAWNEDMPRFDVEMLADEQQAQGTQLGDDLATLDSDLQAENTDALLPGPPGEPGDMQILAKDCAAYGVTESQPST